MGKVKVTTLEVRTIKIDAFVDERGWFSAVIPGSTRAYRANTLDVLRQTLMRETKAQSVKVAVEATLKGSSRYGRDITFVDVTLTGIHASNNAILYRDQFGRASQLDGYRSSEQVYRRLSKEEQEQLRTLWLAEQAASQAYEDYAKSRRLDGREAIRHAIEQAVNDDAQPAAN